MLWEAYYALYPVGHETNYLTKILAALLHYAEWENLRPGESRFYDDKLFQMVVDEDARTIEVAKKFEALARTLRGKKKNSHVNRQNRPSNNTGQR